jgi:hypothetical protein
VAHDDGDRLSRSRTIELILAGPTSGQSVSVITRLRDRDSMAARDVEFEILTAARAGRNQVKARTSLLVHRADVRLRAAATIVFACLSDNRDDATCR